MSTLRHKPLMQLNLTVGFGAMIQIGATPAGLRRIAPVTGGTFEGERVRGTVMGGADWVINRPDGVMAIDVRLTLTTDDSAAIYLSYQGRFLATAEAMTRFSRGGQLTPDEYSVAITAKFECGHERYRWLNNVIAVGTGEQKSDGAIYTLFEIG